MKTLRTLALLLTLTVAATVNAATVTPSCLTYGKWTWKVVEKGDSVTTYAFSIVVISGCREEHTVQVIFAAYDKDGVVRGRAGIQGQVKPGPCNITGTDWLKTSDANAVVRWEVEKIDGY
jgi:hypothetical protein